LPLYIDRVIHPSESVAGKPLLRWSCSRKCILISLDAASSRAYAAEFLNYVLKSVSKDPSFRGPRYWRKR